MRPMLSFDIGCHLSLACADNNNNLENIVKCIEDKQETGCKTCVCSILCYVHAEGDLCRECLQNPSLATLFLNSDKCSQSWTWSNITSTCVKAFVTPRPWKFSSRFCAEGGGRLAQPTSNASLQTVLEAINLQSTAGEYWIGATENEGGDSFIWVGDNSIVDIDHWATGFPLLSGITLFSIPHIRFICVIMISFSCSHLHTTIRSRRILQKCWLSSVRFLCLWSCCRICVFWTIRRWVLKCTMIKS